MPRNEPDSAITLVFNIYFEPATQQISKPLYFLFSVSLSACLRPRLIAIEFLVSSKKRGTEKCNGSNVERVQHLMSAGHHNRPVAGQKL